MGSSAPVPSPDPSVSGRPAVPPAGFTLLELLITVALLAVGLTALTRALSRGILAQSDVANLSTAATIAEEILEDYRDREHSLAAFNTIVSASTATVSGFPGFTRNVVVSFPIGSSGNNARLKRVDVTVAWQVQGTTLTTRVSSYVLRR